MKKNLAIISIMSLLLLPLFAQAGTSKKQPLQQAVERAVTQAVSQAPHYYVPLVQLPQEPATPGADGAEAGIMWVEIGGQYTADGYEPEFFYLSSKRVVLETNDGPLGPFYEPIIPSIFNEAYRRFAADPKSKKATPSQTRQLLTTYYHQVEAEKKAEKSSPENSAK